MIIDPEMHGKGYGGQAVHELLRQGFDNMGLQTIYGECYECNPAISFWQKISDKYHAYMTKLPERKWYIGMLHDSLYFSISKGGYYHVANNT
jgi:RimJ/RimL family protein N-acetyltransferase